MRKYIKSLLVICLLAIMVSSIVFLNGCQSLNPDEGYEALREALDNTIRPSDDLEHASNSHIFYWKESITTKTSAVQSTVKTTTANVLCEIDKDYHFVKDGDGEYDYADLKINVTKKHDTSLVYELMCGVDGEGTNRLAYRGDLNATSALTNNDEYTFEVGTSAKDFVQSDRFAPYTLQTKLAELDSLKKEDIVYDGVPNGGVEKKNKVTTITCKLSDAYLQNYRDTHGGQDSVFNGKYVVIELAYNRISAIFVYQNDPGVEESNTSGILALEYESYKLEIVYTGPKFTVPHKQPSAN